MKFLYINVIWVTFIVKKRKEQAELPYYYKCHFCITTKNISKLLK